MKETSRRLPRVLGLFDISVLSSASMGPAYSLASTMGLMIAAAGGLAPVALVLLTAIMVCVAATFARLSSVLPNAGSSYAWIATAFGPAAGSYGAWILLISNFFATMATALPAGIYTLDLFAPQLAASPVWGSVVGVIWIVASALLLHLGMRPTARTTAFFVIGELLVLGVTATAALLSHGPSVAPVHAAAAPPIGIAGIITAMVLAIWMVDGWEVSASASEETRRPGPTAGRGGVIGLVVTAGVLLFAMSAYLHVGTVDGFNQHSTDALTYVGDQLGGGPWRVLLVVTVLCSTSTALWTTMLYLTRSVYAMGRDGVLAAPLGTLDRSGGPTIALVVVTTSVAAVTLLNGFWPAAAQMVSFVVGGSAVFLGLLFVGSTAAAVRLAPRLGEGPLGIATALVGTVSLLAVIVISLVQADAPTRDVDLALLGLGLPFAVWRRGRRPLVAPAASSVQTG